MSLHFDQLFRKKLEEVPHFVKKHEKPWIWQKLATFRANYNVLAFSWSFQKEVAKSASFREKAREIIDLANTMQLFRTNYHVFVFRWTFQQKVAKSCSMREKAPKIINLAKLWTFSRKLPCLCISINFSGESCKKCLISWKSTTNHPFGQIWITFRTNYHVFAFRWTFQEKVAKSASFRRKSTKNQPFGQNFQLFEQTTMSLHFHELFSKKLQKVPHSVEKHEKSSIWPKLCNFFDQTTMSFHFDQLLGKKLQKVPHFAKEHEKSSICPNLCNFSNKLRCFCISMNFQGKSCQKCFVSWKSTKNHRFGQNFSTFPADYHVLAFRWSFQQKVTKSASFREKARKIVDLARTRNFSNKLPCFDALVNFSAKSCRKCFVFWENSTNHRLGQNLQLFRTKYHVYAFRWTFQRKVAKSASFREKARKIIDLAKTCNFSNKLPCCGISMNFSGKKCKKWPISWKSTNTHPFGQNLQLLEETTMFWHFDDYCRKKLQKGGKSGSFREKWRKIIDLA